MIQGGAQITDREGGLFSGNRSFQDRVQQAAQEYSQGGLSERNKKFVLQLADAIDAQATKNLDAAVDAYVENAPSKLFSKEDLRKIAKSITPGDLNEPGASATVTFIDSDGERHTIPSENLDKAKAKDPGLRVVTE